MYACVTVVNSVTLTAKGKPVAVVAETDLAAGAGVLAGGVLVGEAALAGVGPRVKVELLVLVLGVPPQTAKSQAATIVAAPKVIFDVPVDMPMAPPFFRLYLRSGDSCKPDIRVARS